MIDTLSKLGLSQVGAYPWQGGTLYLGLLPHRPYPADFSVCSHYPGYQQIYLALRDLARQRQSCGTESRVQPELAYKPLAASLGYGWLGRQSLLHHPLYGSYVSIHGLWCAEEGMFTPPAPPMSAPCGGCDRCVRACPTGAVLGNGQIDREKCLRNWMLSGKPVPVALRSAMGQRLLGCDLCQRACPHNPPVCDEPSPALRAAVELKALLENPSASAKALSPLLGSNLMRPKRLLAQALLCAGNSGQSELRPLTEKYLLDADTVVSDHAAWAWERLSSC